VENHQLQFFALSLLIAKEIEQKAHTHTPIAANWQSSCFGYFEISQKWKPIQHNFPLKVE